MLFSVGLTRVAATLVTCLSVTTLISAGGTRLAQAAPPEQAQKAPAPSPASTAPAPGIDPAVKTALTRMGDYLAGLKSFELTAVTTMEIVLSSGHQFEVGGEVRYWAQRPDKLRIDSATDMVERQYFFDGKSLTVVAPKEGFYGQERTPPTITEALAFAAQTLSVELPLADLFDWGTERSPLAQFENGFLIGPAKIGGTLTDHYVLTGKTLDLELWVQQGETPLPLKISIVDRNVASHPRFSALLTWQPNAEIAADVFTYNPANEVKRITFQKPEAPAETTEKGAK